MSRNPHLDAAMRDLFVEIGVRMKTGLLGRIEEFKHEVTEVAVRTGDMRVLELADWAERMAQCLVFGDPPGGEAVERTDGPAPET